MLNIKELLDRIVQKLRSNQKPAKKPHTPPNSGMSDADKELLRLAAKAADIEWGFRYHCEDGRVTREEFLVGGKSWNPLEDNANTLEIETALKLTASWDDVNKGWLIGSIINGSFRWIAFHENRNFATTYAAAEIGKTLC